MILFDMDMGKWVLFFEPILKRLKEKNIPYLVISRAGKGYIELNEVLDLKSIPYISIGEFGGGTLEGKFQASINRQLEIIKIIKKYKITKIVSGSVVDSTRVGFGLGIPVYNFYDIPLKDHTEKMSQALPQARLTIPLVTKFFKPFVIPNSLIKKFGLEEKQIFNYDFIDPLIWIKNFQYDEEYVKKSLKKYPIDYTKKTIVIREEEYKSSYVDKKYPFLYDTLKELHTNLNVNIIIIPRYESDYLKQEFPFAIILEEKIIIQHLLKFSDLFIGGGGTLNSEACFLGTPTISTRSFISHYDKWQIDNNLMVWVKNKSELLNQSKHMIHNKINTDVIKTMSVNIDKIVDELLK